MQDRPTASELLKAAQEFCERDLIPNLSGRVRFHARVLQNALSILEREWEGEEEAVRAERERLRTLLDTDELASPNLRRLADEVRDLNRELGSRIRAGEMDERWEETVGVVYEAVLAKLRIANPRYSPGSSDT